MNSSSRRVALASLLFLPAVFTTATPTNYGFYSEFVGGTITDRITQPYYDQDPDSYYKPEMTGTMSLVTQMTDLFPSDPLHGYYVDTSRASALTFRLEGQQFSFLGNLTFETWVDGESYLSVYDDSFRVSFLFHAANFSTDSVANIRSLTTEGGDNDIDLWTLNAFGGGYAYSDKAVDIWHIDPSTGNKVAAETPVIAPAPFWNPIVPPMTTWIPIVPQLAEANMVFSAERAMMTAFPEDSAFQTFATEQSESTRVPESLPLLAFLAPVLAAMIAHRRARPMPAVPAPTPSL